MKARVMLAVLALALASACSSQPLTTAPDEPNLDGSGNIGSGHRGDPAPDEPEPDRSGVLGSGH